jgi:uncharacterized membrane protein YoaK (UPF0700 family)
MRREAVIDVVLAGAVLLFLGFVLPLSAWPLVVFVLLAGAAVHAVRWTRRIDPTTTPWVIAIIALLAPVALVGMLFLGYVLSLADQ